MKVTVKLINAYSRGKLPGAHNFAPCNLRASIKDLNLTQNIGLGLINVLFIYIFLAITEFSNF